MMFYCMSSALQNVTLGFSIDNDSFYNNLSKIIIKTAAFKPIFIPTLLRY